MAIFPYLPKSLKKRFIKFAWEFFGPWRFFRKSLNSIVGKIFSPGFQDLIRPFNIPLKKFKNPNASDCINWVNSLEFDVILATQSFKIGKSLLNLPSYGILNKHASPLPKYRGVFPVFWVMVNAEKEYALSIHQMAKGYDSGRIYFQKRWLFKSGDSFEGVYKNISKHIPEAFEKAMDNLINPNFEPLPNSDEESSYFSYPDKRAIQKFKAMNLLID